jgi:hypothetical protein
MSGIGINERERTTSPGPHLICHAWGSCMEWVLDPILSVTHGEAVWNESWTPSYLSRMGKLYGMSPGPHLICQAWESCVEWVLDPILSVTHGEAVWNEFCKPLPISRNTLRLYLLLLCDLSHFVSPWTTDNVRTQWMSMIINKSTNFGFLKSVYSIFTA